MIPEKETDYVKQAFSEAGVDRLLGLEGKYFDALVDVVCWSYRNTDSDIWVNSKFQRIESFSAKVAIILGGSFLSTVRYALQYRKYRVSALAERNIAVPFCGAHVRFRDVFDLLGDDTCVLYPPIFHYRLLQSHVDCFEKQGRSLFLGNFRILDILSVALTVIRHQGRLRRCHRSLDTYFDRNYGSLASIVVTSLLYRHFICGIIKRIPRNGGSRRWFFDYDFDYKYIVFNSEIKKARKDDVTIHVQHGSFFGYNDAYCNPVSDVSLCCSPREKKIIEGANRYGSRIFAQGSSWQSIDRSVAKEGMDVAQYDFLVLLTDTASKETAEFQKCLLGDLSRLDAKTLVRYRPQSAVADKKVLEVYTAGMAISAGTSLKRDILNARVVVCFSEDAVFECFRNDKKVLFMVKEIKCYDFSVARSNNISIQSIATYDPSILHHFLNNAPCDYAHDEFVRYNFGDFTFAKVKENIASYMNVL